MCNVASHDSVIPSGVGVSFGWGGSEITEGWTLTVVLKQIESRMETGLEIMPNAKRMHNHSSADMCL